MAEKSAIIPLESIEQRIYLIRGEKVMLDRDLAALYQVKPIALRQQVINETGSGFPTILSSSFRGTRRRPWYHKM